MLVPTRYMTSVPFDWSSVLNDGVLLEANSGFGSGRLGYPDSASTSVTTKLPTRWVTCRCYRRGSATRPSKPPYLATFITTPLVASVQ